MSKSTDTNIAETVETTVNQLQQKCSTWVAGTYKRSNEELYELLSECLDFYFELRKDTSRCKALNNYLRDNKIQFQESSSLVTRIVRAVFNSSFQKRAYAYARVITIAVDEKKPTETMNDFITKRGGIEEIRRTRKNGATPADQRKDRITFAKTKLSEANVIGKPMPAKDSTFALKEGAEHKLFVAVMRLEENGDRSMVYETNADAVINVALAQAGKDLNAEDAIHEAAHTERQRADRSASAVEKAIENATVADAA